MIVWALNNCFIYLGNQFYWLLRYYLLLFFLILGGMNLVGNLLYHWHSSWHSHLFSWGWSWWNILDGRNSREDQPILLIARKLVLTLFLFVLLLLLLLLLLLVKNQRSRSLIHSKQINLLLLVEVVVGIALWAIGALIIDKATEVNEKASSKWNRKPSSFLYHLLLPLIWLSSHYYFPSFIPQFCFSLFPLFFIFWSTDVLPIHTIW